MAALHSITLDGAEISATFTRIIKHRQSFRLKNAVFERETEFASSGKILKIKSARFLSADKPNLGLIKYNLKVDRTAKIKISTGIDYDIWDLNGPHLLKLNSEEKGRNTAGTWRHRRKLEESGGGGGRLISNSEKNPTR